MRALRILCLFVGVLAVASLVNERRTEEASIKLALGAALLTAYELLPVVRSKNLPPKKRLRLPGEE